MSIISVRKDLHLSKPIQAFLYFILFYFSFSKSVLEDFGKCVRSGENFLEGNRALQEATRGAEDFLFLE